ncbi:SDR family oxidoreductase [Streptomyces chartreusis]|uniref:SDR family oxidoreductase n=1 Tax=Streptomyces chartreusis TaxID=1969 RepID=UPI00369BA7D1
MISSGKRSPRGPSDAAPADGRPDASADALTGRTIVMSGGSRGIGLAILKAAARAGANCVLLAKTDTLHPRLPGTAHTAVAAIEAAGGKAVAVIGDVRNGDDVARAVDTAVTRFGGVDICVNNASALNVGSTDEVGLKQFDLMHEVNVRGTYALTRACLPHLRRSTHAHILTLSPPLNLDPRWLGAHPAYTTSKYAMTLLTLGWAAELADQKIAANCLWPQTLIATSAVSNILGRDQAERARSPQIMADAAMAILGRPPAERSGSALIDADVLTEFADPDFERYGGGVDPLPDLFV